MYIERSLVPLMNQKRHDLAFEILESDQMHFGTAVFAESLNRALRQSPMMSIKDCLLAAGIEVRKPVFKEYPFQFDNLLGAAELCQLDRQWHKAAQVYAHIAEHYGNTLWMQTRQANALVQCGRLPQAAKVIAEVNRIRPSVASLLIAARAEKKQKHHPEAIAFYQRALAILRGQETGYLPPDSNINLIPNDGLNSHLEQPEETLVWT
jgi:tetratricopeptide (TPR) repeat protein